MSISAICPKSKTTYKLKTPSCKCGHPLLKTKRYRVRMRMPNGKWKSKVVDSLDVSKKVEARFKTQSIEHDVFNIHHAPFIEDAWSRYLDWANLNKRSWKDDETQWRLHVRPHLRNRKMDQIPPHDIQTLITKLAGIVAPKSSK